MLDNSLNGLTSQGLWAYLGAYLTSDPLTILSLVSAIWLWIVNKDLRMRIFLPLLVMVPCVVNPWIFNLSLNTRYWRYLWMLPRALLTAMAAADLLRRIPWKWVKSLALAGLCAVVMLTGTSWFSGDKVTLAETPHKVDPGIPEICDLILADDPQPRCVFTGMSSFYSRQYSGDIIQLWGRDVEGFIISPSKEVRVVYNAWKKSPKDWNTLFEYMSQHDYKYLVTTSTSSRLKKTAGAYGYNVWQKVGDYKIYKYMLND